MRLQQSMLSTITENLSLLLLSQTNQPQQPIQRMRQERLSFLPQPTVTVSEPEWTFSGIGHNVALPAVTTVEEVNLLINKQVIIQWNDGGRGFRPLKEWKRPFPVALKSMKDTYRMRKNIATAAMQYDSVAEFLVDKGFRNKSLTFMSKHLQQENDSTY
jgi:hypothetical protein